MCSVVRGYGLAEGCEMVAKANGNGIVGHTEVPVPEDSTELRDPASNSEGQMFTPEYMEALLVAAEERKACKQILAWVRVLWSKPQLLMRIAAAGLAIATLIAFLIPKRYEAWTQLMPPDSQSVNGLAALAASSSAQAGIGSLAGSLLGMKSTGALFIGVMRSHAVAYRIIDEFDLQKVYGMRLKKD